MGFLATHTTSAANVTALTSCRHHVTIRLIEDAYSSSCLQIKTCGGIGFTEDVCLSSPGLITRIRRGKTSLGRLPSAALTPVFGRGVAARGDFFTYARPWCHSGLTTQRCSYIIKDEWEIDRWIWRGCRLRWQCDRGHLYTDARRHLPFLPCELSPRCILAATSSCTERTSAPNNSDGALHLAQIYLVCYTENITDCFVSGA